MFSPTRHVYCDFCGRSVNDCGPVATSLDTGGVCHICATCALATAAKFIGGNCAGLFPANIQLIKPDTCQQGQPTGASHAENQKEASRPA